MKRVVVTGAGVLAPNAHGLEDYERALREGRSGIRYVPEMARLNFACQVGGEPQDVASLSRRYLGTRVSPASLGGPLAYAAIAAIDAWSDAGLDAAGSARGPLGERAGVVFGTGGGPNVVEHIVQLTLAGRGAELDPGLVDEFQPAALSWHVGRLLDLGGLVSTNSSACTTGTESVVEALRIIQDGRADVMIAGGADASGVIPWAGFDAMRVLASHHNDAPERASRPMSASAAGFVPSSGAGALVLESLEHAVARGARIHAEVLAGHLNSGGHRNGGSMTAPNPIGVQRCIRQTLAMAGIEPSAIDAINGHLTATMADPLEIRNWSAALGLPNDRFPWINSTKSLVGHALGAAGALECVAVMLQLARGFVHGSINCEDLHPEIAQWSGSVPHTTIDDAPRLVAKASFGFGDVNGCLVLRRWDEVWA